MLAHVLEEIVSWGKLKLAPLLGQEKNQLWEIYRPFKIQTLSIETFEGKLTRRKSVGQGETYTQ
jgi:hypothetical protein